MDTKLEAVGHTAGPWAYAWQTSYTEPDWHFARAVSFSPADIERAFVKNVTPLFAADPEVLKALKIALPQLEDNARFLRDIQAHAGKVVDAFEAVEVVKAVLAKAEGRAS